jgi:hypothetical protein
MKNHVRVLPFPLKGIRLKQLIILLLASIISLLFCELSKKVTQQQRLLSELGVAGTSQRSASKTPFDIAFVSRTILPDSVAPGYIFGNIPGTGPRDRFKTAGPGKLQIYTQGGVLKTLVDGSKPSPATFNITDIQSVDVSYDGTELVFSGLTDTVFPKNKNSNDTIYWWRLFKIGVNGQGLTQLTRTDSIINNAQFNIPSTATYNDFSLYNDVDPVWLPDGRVCFSSTRYPSNGDYAGFRTTELWVVNNDGSGLHRITTERNGADRPVVDPLTGQIVFSRWWFNNIYPHDAMNKIDTANGGYIVYNGLTADNDSQSFKPGLIQFNSWVSAAINPDGSGLHMFAGNQGSAENFMVYGGSLTTSGNLISNFFPDKKLSSESGFGGINFHRRGVGNFTAIDGFANDSSPIDPPVGTQDSLMRYYSVNGFATDVSVMPNNQIVYSWAPNNKQDYGIYVIDSTGHNKILVYNNTGTTELRPKAVVARVVPPVIADQYTYVASLYPPLQKGPYNIDGNFTFKDFNVFANGPVDMDITSAPVIGSVNSIRFNLNQQRTRNGSSANYDWPIELAELTIPLSGKIVNSSAPADVPLFEQLRTSKALGYKVPTTGNPDPSSTAHVAGMNYSRPGATFACVGCHRGHTMIPFPADTTDIEYTNLAPGASIQVSSSLGSVYLQAITNRRVMLDTAQGYFWVTQNKDTANQWVKLVFPVPVKVKAVIPYNIPKGGPYASNIQVNSYQIKLYSDGNATKLVDSQTINSPLSSKGDTVSVNYVIARVIEVKIISSTGSAAGKPKTGLAEVEVIATGDTSNPGQLADVLRQPAEINQLNASEPISVSIYPNPTSSVAHLSLINQQNAVVNYTVYGLGGHMIINHQVSITSGSAADEMIDFSAQPAGIYIVRVSCGTQQKSFKIVRM